MSWPYYRLNYIELDIASATQADSIWEEINRQVCVLVEAMNALDNIQLQQNVWCPSAPDSGSTSSQSTSN